MARQDVKPRCSCGKPIADSAYLCGPCSRSLEKLLAEIPALLTELETTHSRQARTGSGTFSSSMRAVDKPLFWNQNASEAHYILASVVMFRVGLLLDHLGVGALSTPADLARCSTLLVLHLEWLRHHPDGPDCLDELTDAVRKVRRTIDRAPDQWYAGRCGHLALVDTGVISCTQDLWARDDARSVVCQVCGTEYDVEKRRAWLLEQAQDQLATARVLTAALSRLGYPMTIYMIEGYVRRGRLTAHGHSPDGVPLYRVGDALDVHLEIQAARTQRDDKTKTAPAVAEGA